MEFERHLVVRVNMQWLNCKNTPTPGLTRRERLFAEVMQRSLKMASTGDVMSQAHRGKCKAARYNT